MILELFRNKRGKTQIRLKARNGRILMHSEEYERKQNAVKTCQSIIKSKKFKLIDKANGVKK